MTGDSTDENDVPLVPDGFVAANKTGRVAAIFIRAYVSPISLWIEQRDDDAEEANYSIRQELADFDIDHQRSLLVHFCQQQGWDHKIYVYPSLPLIDSGLSDVSRDILQHRFESGRSKRRVELTKCDVDAQLRDDIEDCKIHAVVALNHWRVIWEDADNHRFLSSLYRHGVEYVCLEDSFGTTTPDCNMEAKLKDISGKKHDQSIRAEGYERVRDIENYGSGNTSESAFETVLKYRVAYADGVLCCFEGDAAVRTLEGLPPKILEREIQAWLRKNQTGRVPQL